MRGLRSNPAACILPAIGLLVASALHAPPVGAAIRYAVSLSHPEQHFFHIEMIIPDVVGEVTVQLPAWNALYQIRDFSHHVTAVQAFDLSSNRLPIRKITKQSWHIEGNGTIRVTYASFWDEPGPFSAQINGEHAFLNLALILFYVPGRRGEDVEFSVQGIPKGWRLATPLQARAGNEAAYFAKDYEALVDAPLEAGQFEDFFLTGVQPPIRVVVHGNNWNRPEMDDALRRICKYEISLMGGAPFEQYTFIYHVGRAAAGAGGGMEHANSTAINIPSGEFVAGVSAHEFFHLWNVKRIRPQSLEPVDDSREQWTRALWFAEGVTSTYGSYALLRSGIWKKEQFYEDLSEQITELETRPAARWKSVEEASLDAWLEKYPLYGRPEFSISYYTKGLILGVLLDITIRDATRNGASLDDVLRALNGDFAARGRFYRESEDLRAVTERVAGRSLGEFFSRYVAGTDELPYEQILALAGLQLKKAEHTQPSLGFHFQGDGAGRFVVTEIEPTGPATLAGLREGDTILRWNGEDVPRRPERWLRGRRPGETLRLRIEREGSAKEIQLTLGERVQSFLRVEELPGATAGQMRVRAGLLRGQTDGGMAIGERAH